MHQSLPPFGAYSGAKAPRMLLVGEAWGEAEDRLKRPFAGEAGKELWRMLGQALPDIEPEEHRRVSKLHRYEDAWINHRDPWLEAASIGLTNVFNLRPPGNKLKELCVSRAELSSPPPWPALIPGLFPREEFYSEVQRLEEEIRALAPNLVVAMGNTATWALLHQTNIGSIRGAITKNRLGGKTLPTNHPSAILHQWNLRPIFIADLMKAHREGGFPEIIRPERVVEIHPELWQIRGWIDRTLEAPPSVLACDTETEHGQIKCIGFARARNDSIVIPLLDKSRPKWSYWENPQEEITAWDLIRILLESPIPKVFQNGLYDLQYILQSAPDIRPRALEHDTMLLHHSLFPELRKGLGFLGSIYSNEPAWKLMRLEKADTTKRDE